MNLSVLPASCRQKNLRRSLPTGRRQHLGGGGSIDRSQFEKIFHEREHGAVEPLNLRVRRVDDVVFVRSMGATAVAEAEMAGWQAGRFAGEHVAGPGTRIARPEQRINPMAPVNR